jgi:putative membrane protein
VSAAVEPSQTWRRLSPRMLLIHPIREVGRFVPALLAILFAGSPSGNEWWSLAALVLIVGLSVLRWFTTRYQITAEQVQLRTGLFRRRTLTTPADRVRTVDVTAHALHRVLGLARVAIGTGTSDRKREGLVLDGLSAQAAAALRAELLHRAGAGAAAPAAGTLPVPEQLVAELDPSWIRYAPFTLSGIVSALAVVGLGWRVLSQAQFNADRVSAFHSISRHLRHTTVWLDVVQVTVGALVAVTVLSILGYVLAFWNFRLTRHPGGTLHVSRGLITSRATSISERRLRGVEISQLLPLRAVGGARLLSITTGLRVGRGSDRGGTLLLPACPAAEAHRVAALVLNDPTLPTRTRLVAHGPVARRRRYVRTLVPAAAGWLALVGFWWAGGVPAWVPVAGVLLPVLAAALARDRYTNLGHALTSRYLVSQFGTLTRRRVLVESDGVIGWNLRQSFFQRRSGVLTVTLTTAAGRQSYPISDLDAGSALQLVTACTPGLFDDFLVRGGTAG